MTSRTRPPTPSVPLVLLLGAVAVAWGCGDGDAGDGPAAGVPRDLAERRAEIVDSVRYDLRFAVPAEVEEPVRGRVRIAFTASDAGRGLPLDFEGPEGGVHSVLVNGDTVPVRRERGHLFLPGSRLQRGRNEATVAFTAGDGPLNRNDEFLYTLFVPARAHEAFPSFDQPDLKARYRLTLEIPAGWTAVSNTPAASEEPGAAGGGRGGDDGGRRVVRFEWTRPLSTYLFSFAAGRFEVETATRDGRTMRALHRETDTARVARNRETLFDLHARALSWMERYTGIEYPFEKFDFVLVPSFQYGGMEHPGAILYDASNLFLDRSATRADRLGRASVIAHETAHMWFGDLVTMEWFDDVWMKEVFANFMAAKIVSPAFPELNHDLRFLLDHHPSAYAVDRTRGTHPIRQELDNLSDAGTLYGALIYDKAPVVMRQLETLIGEDAMRAGLGEYLDENRWGNAGWPDLIRVLDARSDEDLVAWSRVWVEEAGRPEVSVAVERSAGGDTVRSLTLRQEDPLGRGRAWTQQLRLGLGSPDGELRSVPVRLTARSQEVPEAGGAVSTRWVLPNAGGLGYGRFRLDSASRSALASDLPEIEDPVARAAAWLTLYEATLDGALPARRFLDVALRTLRREENELIVDQVLDDLRSVYWRFLGPDERARRAPEVEETLWRGLEEAGSSSLRAAYFESYRSVALTDAAVSRLRRIWAGEASVPGLELSTRDRSDVARALAVRGVEGARGILERQAARIENPDRRERFRWVMPALSADTAVRDSVFRALADPENRAHEPWALEALSFLNHPLRAEHARKYVRPSLELLEEVQATGDIFFPGGWLDAALSGHRSPEVARTVRRYLEENPGLPRFLRDKVLQSADPVFRAARISGQGAASGRSAGGG